MNKKNCIIIGKKRYLTILNSDEVSFEGLWYQYYNSS